MILVDLILKNTDKSGLGNKIDDGSKKILDTKGLATIISGEIPNINGLATTI